MNMTTNRTLTMLKPDAIEKGYIGAILEKINAAGFRIVAMKLTQMTRRDAETFYAVHKERPFYNDLVTYMTRASATLPVPITIVPGGMSKEALIAVT